MQEYLDSDKLKRMSEIDENWMWRAIHIARDAAKNGEVPVGSIIVNSAGQILAAESNKTITNVDPTAHAEILALRTAALRTNNYRIVGATVYSTIEPCVMCAGALVNARISRLVFGADDERFGAVETRFGLCTSPELNHQVEITSGVLANECRAMMQDFFRARRK